MKKLAVAVAVLALVGPAFAADYPVRGPAYAPPPSPPPPPPVWDWSGIYVGGNGGFGWADTAWSFPVAQFFAPPFASFSTHLKGALAGGQIGINRQVGSWLFGWPWLWGVEFTGDWADVRESLTGPIPVFPLDTWTTKLTDLETLTVRFGVPVNNWLFYGKAGGASGTLNLHALSGPPIAGVVFDNTERVWGPTIGAGIEYGLTPNLIVGVEYDFIHFTPGAFNGTASNGRPVTVGANSFLDVQSVVGRLSYKFWTPLF